MRRSFFQLDATGNRVFEGHIEGNLWNGWAVPYFTFEQAERIILAWQEQGWAAHYNEDKDVFVFSVNQDFETGEPGEWKEFGGAERNGVKYYGVGAQSWAWEESENAVI